MAPHLPGDLAHTMHVLGPTDMQAHAQSHTISYTHREREREGGHYGIKETLCEEERHFIKSERERYILHGEKGRETF